MGCDNKRSVRQTLIKRAYLKTRVESKAALLEIEFGADDSFQADLVR